MKRKNHLILLVVLIATVFVLGTSFVHAGEGRGVTQDTIVIGNISDYSGPAVDNTSHYNKAIDAYFRHINDNGGIHGRKIKLIKEDDRYSIPMGVAAFKKLIFRDKAFMIFIASTGETFALARQITKHKVPTISLGKADEITRPVKKYIFSSGPPYTSMVKVVVDYIVKDLKAKNPRIAIVCPDTAYGKSSLVALKDQLKFHDLKLADKEILEFGAVDATTQVLGLKRAKATHVILYEIVSPSVALIRDANKMGFKPQMIGHYYSCAENLVEILGNLAEGYLGVHSYTSWYDDCPGMIKARKIVKTYYPDYKPGARLFAEGCTIGLIVEHALRKTGKDLTRENFMKAMESIKDLDAGGISAPITFSKTKHEPSEESKMFKADVNGKRMVPITGWRKPLN